MEEFDLFFFIKFTIIEQEGILSKLCLPMCVQVVTPAEGKDAEPYRAAQHWLGIASHITLSVRVSRIQRCTALHVPSTPPPSGR